MSKNCQIMQRMKKNYESRSRTFLTRRTPVIIRLDGKAFHTYTRGLTKPFDEGLIDDMVETAKFVCSQIQGAKLGYVQSDEISILVTDYDKLTTDAWFDYNVQKITSISTSLATAKFNQLRLIRYVSQHVSESVGNHVDHLMDLEEYIYHEDIADVPLAYFDSRAFNVPREEVANYFLARQKDAVKNSVAMLAQSLYSHQELHRKNGSEMQEMCFQKGVNWNDLHWSKKRGTTIIKTTTVKGVVWDSQNKDNPISDETFIRSMWASVETPMTFDEEYLSKFI